MIDDLKRKIGKEIEIYQPHLKIKLEKPLSDDNLLSFEEYSKIIS